MSVDILNSVPSIDSARLIAKLLTVGSVVKSKTFAFDWFGRAPVRRMTDARRAHKISGRLRISRHGLLLT